jgi:hypothetical protein
MSLRELLLRQASKASLLWRKARLFGQNLKRGLDRDLALIEHKKSLDHLISVAESHNETLHTFGKAIAELNQRTGGDSWSAAVQNAIAHLDGKFDALAEAIGEQQQELAVIKKDWDRFWQQGVVDSNSEN